MSARNYFGVARLGNCGLGILLFRRVNFIVEGGQGFGWWNASVSIVGFNWGMEV